MQLTLREALTLAEPLREARVVAGEGGLDKVIRSVNVMEVPDIADWVHPGEFLVSTLYPLRDDKAAVETLIPLLAEKGLAGLAITPDSYIDELPKCMVEDANRLSFPVSPSFNPPITQSLRVGFPAARYDCSLLRMSSFRRMPESSGSFVDTGLRRCDVMLLIPRLLAVG